MNLPEFPWDSLRPYRELAAQHPDGVVDLSIGTPIDPTPEVIRTALAAAADAHGYPTVAGTAPLREAIARWWQQARRATITAAQVLPTIGSKELVANLPLQLGFERGAKIGFPQCAYPTYDISARLIGATPVALAPDPQTWPTDLDLVWLNTPGNPDGSVLGVAQLREVVAWARRHGVIVVSDECYAPLDWREPAVQRAEAAAASSAPNDLADPAQLQHTPSLLADSVTDGDTSGLLAAYSLSKQSNLAGYRAAFIAGDQTLIEQVTLVRRHSGFIVPTPVQAAMVAALHDVDHVLQQRERYRARRQLLLQAVQAAGLSNHPDSVAGLYLWLSDPAGKRTDWQLVEAFARLGIIVAPGSFYGTAGSGHVRVGLTAPDAQIETAMQRISNDCLI